MPARGYQLWAWVKPWGIVIGTSPKCGTRTLYEALYNHFPSACVKDEENLEVRFANTSVVDVLRPGDAAQLAIPKIWIIRHPWDRFKSLWRQKCRDKGQTDPRLDRKLHTLGPTQLYDFISRPANDNWHWTPQARLMGMIGRPVAEPGITLLRLESLSEWWSYGELPTINPTSDEGLVWDDDDLRRRVETLYKADLELYELAN